MAKECSRHPGVQLKPFCTLEIKVFFTIKFSSLFARTPKKTLPIVFVKAMGGSLPDQKDFLFLEGEKSRQMPIQPEYHGMSKSFEKF